MQTEALDLIKENSRIVGVLAKNQNENIEIRAELIVGADGRHSIVREKSGLQGENLSAPMDVLWFRLPRKDTDAKQTLGRIDLGRILIMIERETYWQCGFLIRKGDFNAIQEKGLDAFRQSIVEIVSAMRERVNE